MGKPICRDCAIKSKLPIVPQGTWLSVCYGCGKKNTQAYETVNTKKATKKEAH